MQARDQALQEPLYSLLSDEQAIWGPIAWGVQCGQKRDDGGGKGKPNRGGGGFVVPVFTHTQQRLQKYVGHVAEEVDIDRLMRACTLRSLGLPALDDPSEGLEEMFSS
jgi:hypothetical protein